MVPSLRNIVVCLALALIGWSTNAFATDFLSSAQYTIVKEEQNIYVAGAATHEAYVYDIGFDYDLLEISSSYPYISIRKLINSKATEYYIVDIENKKLYRMGHDLDLTERRWSPSGDFSYSNKSDSFVLIPSAKLISYLQTSSQETAIRVTGHPLGQIAQEIWLGDILIYFSGIGEATCWGALDPVRGKNYFLDCCGFARNQKYGSKCLPRSEQAIMIIDKYLKQLNQNELYEIELNFYNAVTALTSEE